MRPAHHDSAATLNHRRLLVGVAEADDLNEPRRFLVERLELLRSLGVDIQVALFADGPVRRDLEAVADVRVMAEPAPRSPGGLVQSFARRVSQGLADRVHDARTSSDLAWLQPPDCIHVHGPKAAPVLRYSRDPAVPVTAYAHHLDFSIAGLQPLDLRRLLDRTRRFFAADEQVASDLVASGADPTRIDPVPADLPPPTAVPASRTAVRELREKRGLPADRRVLGVVPVADWHRAPDLTLALAWELERLAGDSAPLVYWCGMPGDGEPRWSVEFDIDRMGLRSVRLDTSDVGWAELVDLSDLVVLPTRSTWNLPDGFALEAARRARPVACWAGHPAETPVEAWGGVVVERGDVVAMARHVLALLTDPGALRRAREDAWRLTLDGIEALTPLSIPFPETSR